MARSIVVKGVESPERLLDETALFLHRVVTVLPPEKQRMLERLHSSDEDLVNKTFGPGYTENNAMPHNRLARANRSVPVSDE